MNRTLIIDTPKSEGKEVLVKGWVHTRRDHGKLIFLDIQDRSALIQSVVNPQASKEAYAIAQEVKSQYVIEATGIVKKRPPSAINKELPTGEVELEIMSLSVLARSQELPFDMGGKTLSLQLPTLFDYRSFTLRHDSIKPIFRVQEGLMEGFRKASKELGCTEVFVPTISASSTEGGADVFRFPYYEHEAFLTQSPQLYKQIMVGVFERVYLVSHAYRAEPSVTTRHLSESIQLDLEIGFIDSLEDLLDAMEFVFSSMIRFVQDACKKELKELGVVSSIPNNIPRLKFKEAQEIITKRIGGNRKSELDLAPEDEREISAWAKEEHHSDLLTITHFPTKKRAFYSKPDPQNPEYSLSYDLLYKGTEVSSGSERISDYAELVKAMKNRNLDPQNFGIYLQAFNYGLPPHGGFSFGLERTTMKLLNLSNIREASLFPRDMERIDERFSSKSS